MDNMGLIADKKTRTCAFIFSLGLSLALVLGFSLERYDHIVINLISVVVFVIVFALALFLTVKSWGVLGRKLESINSEDKAKADREGFDKSALNGYFLVSWVGLILLQLPVLFAEYPGFFVYDAQTELMEVVTRLFTTHHPLLHVLLLGGTITGIHKITDSWNLGIFAYIFMQMVVMTGIFAYTLRFLKKKGTGKKFRTFAFLFLGLFPTIVMYTLCSSKDGLFSAFLLLMVVTLIEIKDDLTSGNGARISRRRAFVFILAASLMMLFRHNGYYCYLVFIITIGIIAIVKKAFKAVDKNFLIKAALVLIIPAVIYITFSTALEKALCQGSTTDHQEMLTVPISQLARTYKYNPELFSKEDSELLKNYIDEDSLNLYTARCTDKVKYNFNNEYFEDNSGAFYDLWLRIGLKAPMTYANAWFLTSYGYWYPGAVINVYGGESVFTFTYDESSYFGYEVEEPGTRHSFIPLIDSFYRKLSIEKFQQNIPGVSLLFAPAFYFWIFMYVFMFVVSRKDLRANALIMLPVLLLWLTVLLGPTYLVRYVIILWYMVVLYPLLLGKTVAKRK